MGEIILKAGLIGTKRKFFHLNLFGCHIYITTHLMRTRQARDKRWLSDEEWHNSEKYKLKSMMYEKMGGGMFLLRSVPLVQQASLAPRASMARLSGVREQGVEPEAVLPRVPQEAP